MKVEVSDGPQTSVRASAKATQTIFHQGSCRTFKLTMRAPTTFLPVDPAGLSPSFPRQPQPDGQQRKAEYIGRDHCREAECASHQRGNFPEQSSVV